MNHLKAFSCKSVLMVFLLLNPYLHAENESSNPEKEEEGCKSTRPKEARQGQREKTETVQTKTIT